jgi:hypothetical protein
VASCDQGAVQSGVPIASTHRLYDASNKIPTSNSGTAYQDECEAAGVPVPRTLVDETDGWVNRGEITTEFLSTTFEAELWTWETDAGICMALPRWSGNDEAELFGLICFGYETGNTCFWDNEEGEFLSRYQAHTIDDLIGGAALLDNAQGVCTNCHAGENPFVVDPYEPAFAGLWGISGDAWPTPIVNAEWIGNPGPISSLGPVPAGQGKCTECHDEANGMRFPLVLDEHTGALSYCETVVGNTIEKTQNAPPATMPPSFASTSSMGIQTERFWDFCEKGAPSDYIEEVDFDPPSPSVLGPLGLGPYYSCAEVVSVRGAVVGATVELWTDYQGPFTAVATDGAVTFYLDDPLSNNENVYAKQSLGGITSAVEREQAFPYPDPLPVPEFLYTPLYACAGSVALKTVPGVSLSVEHRRQGNVVALEKMLSPAGVTRVDMPAQDFQVGDVLIAQQSLCDSSPNSPDEVVELFTDDMQTPSIATVREGQQTVALGRLVQGGSLQLLHDTQGELVYIPSNPTRSRHVGLKISSGINQPLEEGDEIALVHRLCPDDLEQTTIGVIACDPASLAPDVLPAFEGNDFVVVEDGIPGARIDVYGKGLEHIASGSGTEISLTRDLVKDEDIWVTQSLPGCEPTTASKVTVL